MQVEVEDTKFIVEDYESY